MDDYLRLGIILLEVTNLSLLLLLSGLVVFHRNRSGLKLASWRMCLLFNIGCSLLHTSALIFLNPYKMNVTWCVIGVSVFKFGWITTFASILAKLHKFRKEFQTRQAIRIRLHGREQFQIVGLLQLFAVFYLAAWVVSVYSSEIHPSLLANIRYGNSTSTVCAPTPWDWVTEFGELVFLLTLFYWSVQTRKSQQAIKRLYFSILFAVIISVANSSVRHILGAWKYAVLIHTTYINLLLPPLSWFIVIQFVIDAIVSPDEKAPSQSQSIESLDPFPANGIPPECAASVIRLDDFKSELKNLYSQLDYYKSLAMKQNNRHVAAPKKTRTFVSGLRRLSAQVLHYARRKSNELANEDNEVALDVIQEENSECDDDDTGYQEIPAVTKRIVV